MRVSLRFASVLSAVAISLVGTSAARAFSTSEADLILHPSTDGFQDSAARPYPIPFPLEPGMNVIAGLAMEHLNLGGDRDYFSVSLPESHVVQRIVLQVSDFYDAATAAGSIALVDPNAGTEVIDGNGSFVVSPFRAATSPIVFGITAGNDGTGDRSWDTFSYALQIHVVPEPSIALLLGSAVAVSGLAGRSRRNARAG